MKSLSLADELMRLEDDLREVAATTPQKFDKKQKGKPSQTATDALDQLESRKTSPKDELDNKKSIGESPIIGNGLVALAQRTLEEDAYKRSRQFQSVDETDLAKKRTLSTLIAVNDKTPITERIDLEDAT